jgi:hypothetical protein
MKRLASSVVLTLLLIGMIGSVLRVASVDAASTVRKVPTEYATIQEAVDASQNGDVVFVYNGTYSVSQPILIEDKKVSLVGQDPLTTIVDGIGSTGPILHLSNTSDITVSNFTFQNTAAMLGSYGISTYRVSNITFQDYIVRRAFYGISLNNSTNCRITRGIVADCHNTGVVLWGKSSYNEIVWNSIVDNPNGIEIQSYSEENVFYRNYLNNTLQVNIFPPSPTTWDNGAEGNFWVDYKGLDNGDGGRPAGDGIGDEYLPHQGVDYNPLVEPWNETRTYPADSHQVIVHCNFTVASFGFNESLRQVSFYITGPSGSDGYCTVSIPEDLWIPENSSEKWIVMFSSDSIAYVNASVENSTLLSFTYTLGSTMSDNRVRIRVATFIPPTAAFSFTPSPASIIEPVNFTDISVPGEDAQIMWRQWDFGDGSLLETNETFVRHNFLSKADFNVTLTVKDNNTLVDSVSQLVRVVNLYPSADFSFSPDEPFVGLEVEFNASSSIDVDGGIEEYRWTFGDGSAMNTSSPVANHAFQHTPAAGQRYKVNLTVLDHEGYSDSTQRLVPVAKAGTELTVIAAENVKVDENFSVMASLTDGHSGKGLQGELIRFFIYEDGSVSSKNSTTNSSGIATATFWLTEVGEYQIVAEYHGSSDYVESISTAVSLTVSHLSSTLVLLVPDTVIQNQATNVYATLKDEREAPLPEVLVEFHLYDGEGWKLLGSSETNQSGVALFQLVSENEGAFSLRAVFNGFEIYAGSSGDADFTVAAAGTDYTLYILGIVLLAAAVTLGFIVFFRGRKQQGNPERKEVLRP